MVDGTRGHSPASAVPLLLFPPPHLLIILTLCHLSFHKYPVSEICFINYIIFPMNYQSYFMLNETNDIAKLANY